MLPKSILYPTKSTKDILKRINLFKDNPDKAWRSIKWQTKKAGIRCL
jgi:hypothetical protein